MKKQNEDPVYTRRSIPMEYEDYIAQTFGYDSLMHVPKNQFKKVKAIIKERFSQTATTIRKPYSKKTQIVLRGDDETELDFAKRVDSFLHENDVTITQEYEVKINFGAQPQKSILSVQDNKVLTGYPFDEPLPPIPGDAETLGLSNLSPELIKKVAAELLELEKTRKHSVHDEYIYQVDDANNISVADVNLAMKKWREALDELFNDPTTIARRYGQKILNAVPKKHAFARGGFISEEDSFKVYVKTGDSEKLSESDGTRYWWPIPQPRYDTPGNNPETKEAQSRISGFGWDRMEVVNDPFPRKKYFRGDIEVFPETGPEQIIDRAGKTRTAPSDLKIETNQQWSPEELKQWLAKPEQQDRKHYVFREDRVQPGNTTQQRKPYVGMDFSRPGGERTVFMSTSNDGVNWVDNPGNFTKEDFNFLKEKRFDRAGSSPVAKIKIHNYAPDNWPATAPPYHTPEGWEFEKSMKLRNLKSMLTIEWLEKQQTEKHALVAQRLREIQAA